MNDNILYYDIECLPDLFSVAIYYQASQNGKPVILCDVYYLLGPQEDLDFPRNLTEDQLGEIHAEVFKSNPNLDRSAIVNIYNLDTPDANLRLASAMGVHAPDDLTVDFPILKDTDPDYREERDPYIAGYNNVNYDDTMFGFYFSEVFADHKDGIRFRPADTHLLRLYNDQLFDPQFKSAMPQRLRWTSNPAQVKNPRGSAVICGVRLYDGGWAAENAPKKIYDYMVSTGRHLDVARLNEKQFRVGLKFQLGILGYQIMEPETSLQAQAEQKKMNFRTLKNTLAYNCSDVIQLSHLMEHCAYKGPFILKKQMLLDYPGSVYQQKQGPYEPDIRPDRVRKDRLTINASSAKLAAASLCPYGNLSDIPYVKFDYPHPEKARERGVQVTNVLNQFENFVNTRMRPLATTPEGMEIIEGMEKVIAMYRNLEDKDFNSSHEEDFGPSQTYNLKALAKVINVPYMGPDGKPTSGFVSFSVGGIHGAEYNKALYEYDVAQWEKQQKLFARVKDVFGTPENLLVTTNAKGKPCRRKTFELDGAVYEVKDFLKASSTMKKAEWKASLTNASKPELFPLNKKGNTKLDDRYAFTSFGMANHEDFTSYYPRMLSQMMAFWNELMGRDPYEEIFQNKSRFGKMMKDPQYDKEMQALYSTMRNGTKLILNSASGAADTEYKTSIRMNNQITKMRVLGQMFSYMIGSAQALEGAVIPSTNTDGIYTFMEEKKNNEILFREAALSGVEIEPERLYLISKDTNNRIEFLLNDHLTGDIFKDVKKIKGASGGTIGCMDGPDPNQSIDHPAIMDYVLAWTLIKKALVNKAMDAYEPDFGMYMLTAKTPLAFPTMRRYLIMFQHILKSSPGTHCYNFASRSPITDSESPDIEPVPLQHYTRIFYVKPENIPEEEQHRIVYIAAAYMMKMRETVTRKESPRPSLPAIRVIRDFAGDREAFDEPDKIAKVKKVKNLDTVQPVMIVNEDLDYCNFDPSWLDLDYYNRIIGSTYANAWENHLPPADAETPFQNEESAV